MRKHSYLKLMKKECTKGLTIKGLLQSNDLDTQNSLFVLRKSM